MSRTGGPLDPLTLLLHVAVLSVAGPVVAWAWHAVRPGQVGVVAAFGDHARELRARLVLPAVWFFGAAATFFGVGHGSAAFTLLAQWLVPPGVELVVLGPFDAVMAHLQASLVLAVLATLPILLYEAGAFLLPALEQRQRRALAQALPAAFLLFVVGAGFGLFAMAPILMRLLYAYADGLTAAPLLGVGQLVGFASMLTIGFALAFELPAAMVLLSRVGLVSAQTWAKGWRHAVVVAVVMGALVTDPSPVTQLLVAGPLVGLYAVGAGVARLG